jgi:thiamine-phosphate pyrophosphorylase
MSERPELYLTIEPAEAARERLRHALAQHEIACVRVSGGAGGTDRSGAAQSVSGIVAECHAARVPVVLTNQTDLVQDCGADGVHLLPDPLEAPETYLARIAAARAKLGGDAILGASAGPTRHEAMQLGEADVSYLMFEPELSREGLSADDLIGEDLDQPLWLARLKWWAEVFEIPAVAGGISVADQAAVAAATGAEFLELRPPVATSAGDLIDWIGDIKSAIAARGTA